MGLTREQEIKALRWLLDRKDREEWPHCYETWRELATLTGADYEAVAVWDLHGDRWIHVVPGRSGLFPIERAEKRLAELTGNQPCRCGQPAMMDSVLCADCRTVDEAAAIEGTPQPIQPPRPYDGITDWMHPNMSTVGERWR